MTIQLNGLRQTVDPHWKRGLSYLKIGLRWLKGVLHKGRDLLFPIAFPYQNTQPCFASKKRCSALGGFPDLKRLHQEG